MSQPIRVLLVDDSQLVQEILTGMLERHRDIRVVGCAANGMEALRLNRELEPDLLILDLDMPVMDGLTAIDRLMESRPVPILVLTGMPRGKSGMTALTALRRGALDLLVKPAGWSEEESRTLIHRVRTLSRVSVHRRPPKSAPRATSVPSSLWSGPPLVAIGASTGGPPALVEVLSKLPADFAAAVLIVQHIGEGFDHTLAQWLDEECALPVRVARDGEVLVAGTIRVGPVGYHLTVGHAGQVVLDSDVTVDGHRPSVTRLFNSVAAQAARRTLGVLLTGMGRDGASGLLALRKAGGRTVAQDEDSSVVYGMPRAAAELGAAEEVLPLSAIGARLLRLPGVR